MVLSVWDTVSAEELGVCGEVLGAADDEHVADEAAAAVAEA